MDLSNLQLPTTLVNSVKGFNFVEEPLWRVSQQRATVKIEITWTLPDTNLPTKQPTGPGLSSRQDSEKTPTPTKTETTAASENNIASSTRDETPSQRTDDYRASYSDLPATCQHCSYLSLTDDDPTQTTPTYTVYSRAKYQENCGT